MAFPTNVLHVLRAVTKPNAGFVAVNNFFAMLNREYYLTYRCKKIRTARTYFGT